MKDYILIEDFGDRKIAIHGIGKAFYQDGFPIEVSIQILKDKGVEVSLFHVADELLKHGWTPGSVVAKLSNELGDSKKEVEKFCNTTYGKQRKMIFDYLFKDMEAAKKWLNKKI